MLQEYIFDIIAKHRAQKLLSIFHVVAIFEKIASPLVFASVLKEVVDIAQLLLLNIELIPQYLFQLSHFVIFFVSQGK